MRGKKNTEQLKESELQAPERYRTLTFFFLSFSSILMINGNTPGLKKVMR